MLLYLFVCLFTFHQAYYAADNFIDKKTRSQAIYEAYKQPVLSSEWRPFPKNLIAAKLQEIRHNIGTWWSNLRSKVSNILFYSSYDKKGLEKQEKPLHKPTTQLSMQKATPTVKQTIPDRPLPPTSIPPLTTTPLPAQAPTPQPAVLLPSSQTPPASTQLNINKPVIRHDDVISLEGLFNTAYTNLHSPDFITTENAAKLKNYKELPTAMKSKIEDVRKDTSLSPQEHIILNRIEIIDIPELQKLLPTIEAEFKKITNQPTTSGKFEEELEQLVDSYTPILQKSRVLVSSLRNATEEAVKPIIEQHNAILEKRKKIESKIDEDKNNYTLTQKEAGLLEKLKGDLGENKTFIKMLNRQLEKIKTQNQSSSQQSVTTPNTPMPTGKFEAQLKKLAADYANLSQLTTALLEGNVSLKTLENVPDHLRNRQTMLSDELQAISTKMHDNYSSTENENTLLENIKLNQKKSEKEIAQLTLEQLAQTQAKIEHSPTQLHIPLQFPTFTDIQSIISNNMLEAELKKLDEEYTNFSNELSDYLQEEVRVTSPLIQRFATLQEILSKRKQEITQITVDKKKLKYIDLKYNRTNDYLNKLQQKLKNDLARAERTSPQEQQRLKEEANTFIDSGKLEFTKPSNERKYKNPASFHHAYLEKIDRIIDRSDRGTLKEKFEKIYKEIVELYRKEKTSH